MIVVPLARPKSLRAAADLRASVGPSRGDGLIPPDSISVALASAGLRTKVTPLLTTVPLTVPNTSSVAPLFSVVPLALPPASTTEYAAIHGGPLATPPARPPGSRRKPYRSRSRIRSHPPEICAAKSAPVTFSRPP